MTIVEQTDMPDAPVVIVGGGLSGMATATFLAHYGVRCMLVERRQEIPHTSRNERFNTRTMEVLRTLGLDDDVRRAGFPEHELGDMIQVDTLVGGPTARHPQPWVAVPPEVSPIEPYCCNHSWFLGRLRDKAGQLGVDIRPGVELTDVEVDADGVTTILAGLGTVRASYLIGADGPHSLVRGLAGIAATGPGTVAHQHVVLFRASLDHLVPDETFAGIQIDRVKGTLLKESAPGAWALVRSVPSDDPVELIRTAVGLPELDVQIDEAVTWPITLLSADSFGAGRTFLVGDAAHSMPDTPGLHGDTVLQDAQNLAWKLAAVLSGAAGAALLDTYEPERRPLAELSLADALARLGGRPAPPGMPDRLAFDLGWVYRSSAVVPAEGPGNPAFVDPHTTAGLPGMRAPFVDADLFGHGFVLVAGSQAWLDAAKEVVVRLDVPITAHLWSERASAALLVRPDGVVGWRCSAPAGSEERELEYAIRCLLSIETGEL